MFKLVLLLGVVCGCYLGYKNFVQGTKAESIALKAAEVGKQTVTLGKEGLDTFDAGIKSHVK